MASILIDGVRFHYLDVGSGSPLLFVHGNVASTRWWLPTLERLPIGLRAIVLDMSGYGLSDKPGTGYTIAQRTADLQNFVTMLDLGPVHLVGHSLGGAVALQFTLDHPGLVRSLTLLDSVPLEGMPTPRSLEAAIPMLLTNRPLFVQALRRAASTGPFGNMWERLVDDGMLTDPQAWIGAGRTLGSWNVERQATTLALPTLVVHGATDTVVSRDSAEQTARIIPDARLIVMDGIGHSPNVERPDEWSQLLVAFISAQR